METSHIDLAILNYAANNICLDADRGETSTFIYCFDSIATQIAALLEKLGFTTEIKEHNGYVIKSIEGTMVKLNIDFTTPKQNKITSSLPIEILTATEAKKLADDNKVNAEAIKSIEKERNKGFETHDVRFLTLDRDKVHLNSGFLDYLLNTEVGPYADDKTVTFKIKNRSAYDY
ncbi:hypothetical protein K7E08_05635 [Ligilactobacillus salivarius]|uniref:Uncharacterized protein n=1 Tax=Ligilactobacillus salivarius GJ-24 TaxID=1041521 RepID=F7QRS9_9LACO|nr:hypothetical protein [Ligilactobacillus salivarius]EGM52710.1 hypothetical protein LSGJ_00100 [Ligilactobacillus salivarius GJ-24]MBZ4030424.1 hypothetical protein [Ligilactobacillus salivarius]OQQ76335.1 hypothetical protein B6U63_00775 [Ligilactobacillus salivarius]